MTKLGIVRAIACIGVCLLPIAILRGCSLLPDPVKDWRSIGLCGLVDHRQLGTLVENPGTLTAEPLINADTPGDRYIGCKFKGESETVRLSIVLREASEGGIHPEFTDREFQVANKKVVATYERDGDCNLAILLQDKTLTMTFVPEFSKRAVAVGDTSSASCDAQKPVVESVIERVGMH
ncbi:hypothetical protein AB0H76_33345 [Nocardia sp. NPDC050712]|uniref:hypothetical protein n=1 Tax=Nocardia sp. NPDC050712 TaxID=3155518 RepID=UPI0033F47B7C